MGICICMGIYIYMCVCVCMGFPDGSVVKEFACNVGDPSLIPGSG